MTPEGTVIPSQKQIFQQMLSENPFQALKNVNMDSTSNPATSLLAVVQRKNQTVVRKSEGGGHKLSTLGRLPFGSLCIASFF